MVSLSTSSSTTEEALANGVAPASPLTAFQQRAEEWFRKLTAREILLIVGALVIGLVMGIVVIVEEVRATFADQQRRLALLQEAINNIPARLETHARLKARRQAIEQQFRMVEMREGALSYLENLIKTKAGVPSGAFTIKDFPSRSFGKDFEQTPYSVKFTTSNLSTLIEFLRELVHGEQPFLVSKLDLRMARNNEALEVELEVSSIRRVRGEENR